MHARAYIHKHAAEIVEKRPPDAAQQQKGHNYTHANAPPKRTTVRVLRCHGTHLTFGVTRLVCYLSYNSKSLFMICWMCDVYVVVSFEKKEKKIV